jgi:hypothetical protein
MMPSASTYYPDAPGEPVTDLGLWPVVVERRLLGVAEALAFDDRFHDLAD